MKRDAQRTFESERNPDRLRLARKRFTVWVPSISGGSHRRDSVEPHSRGQPLAGFRDTDSLEFRRILRRKHARSMNVANGAYSVRAAERRRKRVVDDDRPHDDPRPKGVPAPPGLNKLRLAFDPVVVGRGGQPLPAQ